MRTGNNSGNLNVGVLFRMGGLFSGSFYIKLLSIIFISCLGILVYSNTFHCSFCFDDNFSIIHNPFIKNVYNLHTIWDSLPRRFILYLSLALNYHFNGFNVFGYHLFNLTVHLVTAVLVWWLTLLTLSTPVMKEQKVAQHANLMALFVGLVFVSHPVQTEAVTYIVQRAASMATLFYLASLCFWVKSRLLQDSGATSGLWQFCYTGSLLTAIAAMFTKEIAITLPLTILFYEFSFLKTKKSFNYGYLIPFLLTLFIIPLTMYFTESVKAQQMRGVVPEGPTGISSMHYLLTQFRVMGTYIRLVFLPFNQNLDYDYPIFRNIFELPVLTSFLFLMMIFFLAKRLFSKHRLVSFSIFWFFLTLFPESSVFPIKDVIFEHRLYLPLVGYSLFLVSSMYYLFGKNTLHTMVVALTMIIAGYSILAYQRNKVWENEISLWNDTIRKSPHKARPYLNRGWAYYNQGRRSQAIGDYNKAIDIVPEYALAYYNRAIEYDNQGQMSQAISDYNKAIALDPNYALAYYNRGCAYDKQGQMSQAISDYTQAIDIDPHYAWAYNNRGWAYYKQGRFTQALADYNKAIETDSYDALAYNNRGWAYYNQGRRSQAIADFSQAIAIAPNFAKAYYNRASAYNDEGRFLQAIADFDKAIAIDPNHADAYYNRGLAYNNQGRISQAISDYNKAIAMNPHYALAYNNRAFTYYKLKEYKKAWGDVHKAEELGVVGDPKFISALKKASGGDQ